MFEVIITKEELYDKCENMEQLYDKFYYPLLVEYKELKKQVEDYKEQVNKGLYNTCLPYTTGYNKAIKDKEIQQKEFIKYLEDETSKWHNNYDSYNYEYEIEEPTAEESVNEILQKYKSIIGVSDEKEN